MIAAAVLLDVVLAVSIVLALGIAAVLIRRVPALQQRHAETAVAAAGIVLVLAVVPMPRWSWQDVHHGPLVHDAVALVGSEVQEGQAALGPPLITPAIPLAIEARPAPFEEPLRGVIEATTIDLAAPAPTPPAAPAGDRDLWTTLLQVHIAGSFFALFWLICGLLRIRRCVARATPLLLDDRHDIPRPPQEVRVLVSTGALRPFCVGWFRPTIVVPQSLVDGPRHELTAILRHEYAHATRGDGFGRVLFALTLPLLWSHPMYWWLQHRWRFAAERMADEVAAGHQRAAYARALLDYAERHGAEPAPLAPMSILWSTSDFYRRMTMLLQRTSVPLDEVGGRARALRVLPYAAAVMACAMLLGNPVMAQNDKELAQVVETLRRENQELRLMVEALRHELRGNRNRSDRSDRDIIREHILKGHANPPVVKESPTASIQQFEDLKSYYHKLGNDLLKQLATAPAEAQRNIEAQLHLIQDTIKAMERFEAERMDVNLPASMDRVTGATPLPSEGPKKEVRVQSPVQSSPVLPRGNRSAQPSPETDQAAQETSGTRIVRDLHDSLDRLIEHQAGLQIAREQAARARTLASSGHITAEELAAAQHRLAMLERKFELARAMITAEWQATVAELEMVEAEAQSPRATAATRMQALHLKARKDLLQRYRVE